MLLADKNDEYIDLHIDQGKLYYHPEDKTKVDPSTICKVSHMSSSIHHHIMSSEKKYLSKSATNLEHSYFQSGKLHYKNITFNNQVMK